jgi:hypothetical protein
MNKNPYVPKLKQPNFLIKTKQSKKKNWNKNFYAISKLIENKFLFKFGGCFDFI